MSTSAATPRPGADRGAHTGGGRRHETVASITDAQESLEADQARRLRVYLLQMGFRVVCFFGAYLASGWLRWSLVVFAVVIPYVAVILVNAGRDRSVRAMSAVPPGTPRRLPAPVRADDGTRIVVDPGSEVTARHPDTTAQTSTDPDPQEP